MTGFDVGMRTPRPTGRPRRRARLAGVAVGTLLVGLTPGIASAATGGPDAGGYTFADSAESGGPASGPFTSIASTGTDIGNHGDEEMTAVALPFPVSLYDVNRATSINVNSNGNVQFDTDASSYDASPLPTGDFSTALLPFWADLVTDVGSDGIFTQAFGAFPDRQFVIEWDAHTYSFSADPGTPEKFQLVFSENSPTVEFRYLDIGLTDVAGDVAHVVGIQGAASADGQYLQYDLGSTEVANDLAVDFTRVPPDSATSLTASTGSTSVYGQLVTLRAAVTRTDGGTATPTGTVTFTSDGAALGTVPLDADGVAELRTRKLGPEDVTVRATYSGDGDTDASASNLPGFHVIQARTTTTINAGNGTIRYGNTVTATVAVVAPGGLRPSGSVAWYDELTGHQLAYSPLRNGVATLPAHTLPVGQYALHAYFVGGGSRYGGSDQQVDVTVLRAPTAGVTLTSSANPATPGSRITYSATVHVENRDTTPTGAVSFYRRAVLIRTAPLNAHHVAKVEVLAGKGKIVAFYEGDDNFYAAQSNVVVQRFG